MVANLILVASNNIPAKNTAIASMIFVVNSVAKEILDSGRALEMMNNIIKAQGKVPQPKIGKLSRDITANVSGVIESIDNARLNKIGVLAGAGQYAGAGIDLFKAGEYLLHYLIAKLSPLRLLVAVCV